MEDGQKERGGGGQWVKDAQMEGNEGWTEEQGEVGGEKGEWNEGSE